jgi:DUF305 family protein family protein
MNAPNSFVQYAVALRVARLRRCNSTMRNKAHRRNARMFAGFLPLVALFWGAHGQVPGATASSLRHGAVDPVQRERQYLDSSMMAMTTMMRDMQISGSGDVDHDFVIQMIAHHQAAIDMAIAMLRSGHNQQLIRLANEIIVTQREEIVAMRLAIAEPKPGS